MSGRKALRARAIALHRAGRLEEAERMYSEVLRQNPTDVLTLTSSAAALRDLGRPAEALARASAALTVQPSAIACCHQGAALRDLGRFTEALASFERAVALEPRSVEAHNYRGMTLQQLRRPAEALASFDAALGLRPQSAELHSNRGIALRRLQRLPEALASFERAIALQGDLAAAYNNRGLVLQLLGRHGEAAESYRRAIELQPGFAEAHNNLGTAQCELGEPAAALVSCRQALALQPGMRGVHANLGNALRDLGEAEHALAEYELALHESPRDAASHSNRGNALFDLKRIPEAIESYDRAIALDPHHAQAHFNKSLCLLLSGDFEKGLPLYEWRKQLDGARAQPPSGSAWLGQEDIAGRTLLVYADQALGDTIQICRYAKLAEARGARVVLAAQPQLGELLRTLSPAISIVAADGAGASDAPGAPCDRHCALMSLPLAFRTTPANIPAEASYLSAEPRRVADWGRWLGAKGLKIGIAWQGSRNRIDIGRSVPPGMFARLARVPGVRLVSLQKGAAAEELRAAGGEAAVEIPRAPFDEGPQAFLDSAALMTALDLVITCDTALAHLAGALGRPTWVALKYVPDWRWLLDRDDSPWYPGVRLFRQPRPGDWESVFAAIHRELVAIAAPRAA
jgi:tetratricopeptide (TPR) repeat protein